MKSCHEKKILNPLIAKVIETATFRQVYGKINHHKDFMSNLETIFLAFCFFICKFKVV